MHTVSEAESEEGYNSNDDIGRDWYRWCRICAKADVKNVNIFIEDEDMVITDGTTDYNSAQISMAIGKYFEVEMKHKEQLPMELCTDCLLMIISLINFNKRVIKVQQMYIALQQLNDNAAKNFEDFRLKYGVFENDEAHHFTYGSAVDFQLFVEKREIEQLEEEQEALIDKLPDETCAAFEIKIEKHHDFTPLMTDGDFCDFEMLEESFDSDCVFNNNDDGGYDISDKNSSQININDETNSETILTDISQIHMQHSTNEANVTKNTKQKHNAQRANTLVKHLKYDSENDDDSYYCVECCKAFKTFGYYRSHMEREHAQTTVESRYTCSDCTLSFNTRNKLNCHRYKKHTPLTLRQKFKCSYCDQPLTTKTALEQHIRFVHRHERPVICEECGIGVRTNSELIKHMLTHSDYAAFECEICKKRFKSRERLKRKGCSDYSFKSTKIINGLLYPGEWDRKNSSQININDETNSETILTDISQIHMQHSTNEANVTKNTKQKHNAQRANTLVKHLKYDSENDDDSYYCVECCKAFKTFGYYRSHMEREHAQTTVESRYTCSDCTLSFNTRNKLNCHRYKKHTPLTLRQKFKCSYCDQPLTTKTALEQHIRFVHRHERPVICEECGIGVRTNSELIKHMLTHSDYAAFECEICKKRFKSRERLKRKGCSDYSFKSTKIINGLLYPGEWDRKNSSQININDETNSETILTDISQIHMQHSTNEANVTKNTKQKHNAQRANTLVKHLKYDSENDDDSYYCVECCKAFKTFGYYRSHMEREHAQTTVESRYTCSDCTLSFNTRNKLNCHRYKKHTPLTLRQKFKCSYCDQPLTTKTALEQHIRFVHRHERPVICEECGIGVRTNSELIKHMLTHSDYAAFECEICKKRFKSRERLKKHNRTHSPTRHICTKCGLALKSQTTLNNHLLVHSDVKPHKCDYCEKTFKRTKELKNHLILHTGLKLYSCNFCEKTFAGASNMRAHKKVKHPKEVAAEDASGEKIYAKNIPKLEVLKSV